MRDQYYADNRDLIKWGVLLHLAETFEVRRIVQLAFYRPSTFKQLQIDGKPQDIPKEVIAHFRDIQAISRISAKVKVDVFSPILKSRDDHLEAILAYLTTLTEKCIVFLDPDTGLEPPRAVKRTHVLEKEAFNIWDHMKQEDVFVFYQHKIMFAKHSWIDLRKEQLANALGVPRDAIKMANAPEIANDVVFYFIQKPGCRMTNGVVA
jgi:hypothetical protein